jgi:hypothetical protein
MAKTKNNGATVGFEETLWQAADKMHLAWSTLLTNIKGSSDSWLKKHSTENAPESGGIVRHCCDGPYRLLQSDRLLLYWTGEPTSDRALMESEYKSSDADSPGAHFDDVVSQVLAEKHEIKLQPEVHVCRESDLCSFCEGEVAIQLRKEAG